MARDVRLILFHGNLLWALKSNVLKRICAQCRPLGPQTMYSLKLATVDHRPNVLFNKSLIKALNVFVHSSLFFQSVYRE